VFVSLIGNLLRKKFKRSPGWGETPSILVIRRNRLGDMICTLPLIENLRGKFPKAKITVACDAIGAPIARACPLVDEVVVLRTASGLRRWTALIRDAAGLQDFDWVIAVKGGFDMRLACLARWTNAPVRIGFGRPPEPGETPRRPNDPDPFFTDILELPPNLYDEHQVDTQLRLLEAVGISRPRKTFPMRVPEEARRFADQVLSQPPFHPDAAYAGQLSEWVREDHSQEATLTVPYILFNVSSTVPLLFPPAEQKELLGLILANTGYVVGEQSSTSPDGQGTGV
jgi:ADP-heptose:LPS heptosyltransferase